MSDDLIDRYTTADLLNVSMTQFVHLSRNPTFAKPSGNTSSQRSGLLKQQGSPTTAGSRGPNNANGKQVELLPK
jgi:hypothetical protein